MPQFYFHLTDGYVDNDRDGVDLPDLRTARLEALRFAGAYLHDNPEIVWDGNEFRVEVTDENGQVLITIITLAVDAPTQRRAVPSSSRA